MSVPQGWIQIPVDDVFDVVGGGTPSTAVTEYWAGSIPWITSADIDERHNVQLKRFVTDAAVENSATNIVPAGSIIVVTRVGLGKVAVAPAPMCFSQDSQALIFPEGSLNSRYVLLFMSTAVGMFRHISRGTTISGVTKKQLKEVQFLLPPRPEQDRIVAEIEKQLTRLDAAVAALKRVQANLKRYRAAVLKAACEGRLVPTEAELARNEGRSYESGAELLARILQERRAKWEADQFARMLAAGKPPKDDTWKRKYKEPEPPVTSGLPPLPKGWTCASLAQLAFIVGGITKGQKRRQGDVLRSVPYLRVANVQRGYLDLEEIRTIEATEAEIEDLQLQAGDVLFTEGGDRDKLGRGWIWEGQIPLCIHQNHVFRARPTSASILPKFVSQYANAHGQTYFMTEGKQTTNLASINLSKLSRLPVSIPPTVEQQRIVEELDRQISDISATERTCDDALNRANRLRQSILKRAFEGKLAQQDPNDEPASVLLERIRAERSAVSRNQPPRKGRTAERAASPL